jgi:hypothetical protein
MKVATVLAAALVTCAVQAADEFPAILERTSAYVAKFEQEFASIIWHETYEQIDRLPRTFGASGGRFAGVARRHLESEMLFIRAESDATWLTVRDVISVDGELVPRRLPTLLASPNVWIRDLRALSQENGRYNIGAIYRNFNDPTLALSFLDSRYRRRFRFTDGGPGEIDGSPVKRIRFVEVVTPTVIRNENRSVRASGALIVEPATGRVLRTELTLLVDKNNDKNVRAELTVSYRPDARLGLLVPVEMHESYGFAGGSPDERIECTATYSDFRRFETAGRVIE